MSEYQYYEFLSIDRPLKEDEMAELRALSTRATITPVSFTNEYNWGDSLHKPPALPVEQQRLHRSVENSIILWGAYTRRRWFMKGVNFKKFSFFFKKC